MLPFWSPLLDANINPDSRARYKQAVTKFLAFVEQADGQSLDSAASLDYWLAYFAHDARTNGTNSRSTVEKALFGCEHWLPEAGRLPLARRCLRGWQKLQPPRPYAPMPRDLALAAAAMAALEGNIGVAIAILLGFDAWLRISEVAALTAADVFDTTSARDLVARGVSVFLAQCKTGRRQAVRLEDAATARLVVAWAVAARRQGGNTTRLFGSPALLRDTLSRCLRALDDGSMDLHGLCFVWHSLRHGGASRAYLAGMPLADVLTRGRWKAERSGRHYIQAGRQLLLTQRLPVAASALAKRLMATDLLAIVATDVRATLRAMA